MINRFLDDFSSIVETEKYEDKTLQEIQSNGKNKNIDSLINLLI